MGTQDGSIIAAIITTHIVRNEAVPSIQVCPGIRIHIIDIVQPPGIGIPRISDMDAHESTVSAALAANSAAAMPTKARSDVRSDAIPMSRLRQIPGSKLLVKEVL
jgi:hypothetical protein